MDLEPDGSVAGVGGICVVCGLGAVEPDLEAVAAGADTERIPFALLEKGSVAFATARLRIDIVLGARVETASHIDLEGVGLAELDLELRFAEKDSGIHDASPHDFKGQIKVYLLGLCVERRAGLLLIVDPDNRAILDRPNARIPRGTPARIAAL